MNEKNITTEGPVNQAPAPSTEAKTETTQASETAAKTADTTPKDNPGPVAAQQQPATNDLRGYLDNGYYLGAGKERYTDPVLVDQAEEIGKALAAGKVTPAAFNRLVRTLKAAEKLPFPAQRGAIKKLLPQVTDLENHKKAPPMLREIVERNRAAVQTEADFAACLDHFRDIAIYLAAAKAS